jgi:hypothetical protein
LSFLEENVDIKGTENKKAGQVWGSEAAFIQTQVQHLDQHPDLVFLIMTRMIYSSLLQNM